MSYLPTRDDVVNEFNCSQAAVVRVQIDHQQLPPPPIMTSPTDIVMVTQSD